jgi:hypothetical protein
MSVPNFTSQSTLKPKTAHNFLSFRDVLIKSIKEEKEKSIVTETEYSLSDDD